MSSNKAEPFQMSELREFATFTKGAQRYIRISLEISIDDPNVINRWSRDICETAAISAQRKVYGSLPSIRAQIPTNTNLDYIGIFMGNLIRVSTFDLLQGKLSSFPEYRFLYERLLGAAVREWLPSSYCGAAAMPNIDPAQRKKLLQSISEAAATAAGWSNREPTFFPEWVEKIDESVQ